MNIFSAVCLIESFFPFWSGVAEEARDEKMKWASELHFSTGLARVIIINASVERMITRGKPSSAAGQ